MISLSSLLVCKSEGAKASSGDNGGSVNGINAVWNLSSRWDNEREELSSDDIFS